MLYLADIPPVIESTYSSALSVNNSQVYGRGMCASQNYYYEAIQINIIKSGSYTFSSNSNIYTYSYLYRDHFNPFNVTENLLFENRDGCFYRNFKLLAYLHSNTTYTLIATTFAPNVTGSLKIFASGPDIVALNRTSKFLQRHYFHYKPAVHLKVFYSKHKIKCLEMIFI